MVEKLNSDMSIAARHYYMRGAFKIELPLWFVDIAVLDIIVIVPNISVAAARCSFLLFVLSRMHGEMLRDERGGGGYPRLWVSSL